MRSQSFFLLVSLLLANQVTWCNAALSKGKASAHPATSGSAGVVYPQCLYQGKVVRWIKEQQPLRVWVSHGLSLDSVLDPETGVQVTNTANKDKWGDAVVEVLTNRKLETLGFAPGFSEDLYRAARAGIGSWQVLQREGIYSFEFTENPDDADICVFWTDHFVNEMGLGLFENDIRGYTSKHLLPIGPVLSAMQRGDLDLIRRSLKPVVILLRTTQGDGSSMPPPRMQASAAHEMGHALGIDQHSPYPTDLMSVYYGRGVIAPNDLATMRYIYRRPADYIP